MSGPGTIMDRYRVERLLGAGGMASVHLARDLELDRLVAVKLLAEAFADDRELRARFVREARLAARLTHPNVVTVFDAGEEAGRPFMVMEYVEGETLADVLHRRGRVPAGEAVGLVLQACDGLAHAHDSGLVHRDVKPQNLLLREDGVVKVADFGIARAAEGTLLTQAGTILGTAAYLAPEQAAGEQVGPAADVYALGAVLYELLTGRPPHEVESLDALARRQEGEPVQPASELARDVPHPVEDVLMRALARVPEYRPPTAGDLAVELRRALGEEPDRSPVAPPPVEAEAPTRVLGSRRGERRAGWAVAVAVAAAATLAVAGAAGLLLAGDEGDDAPEQAPVEVEPVPPGATPEEQARNLAEWLRRRAGSS